MEIKNRDQIYHILQNLSNLEISYVDYSRQEINYNEYHTYFDYFNNYVIQNHNLTRFYFPIPKDMEHLEYPNDISNFDVISDSLTFLPGFDISVSKLFNFPKSATHQCNYYSMLYLMEGNAHLQIQDVSVHVFPGDFYLIPPNTPYAATAAPESIGIVLDMRKSFLNSNYKSLFQDDARLERFFINSLNQDSSSTHLAIHTNASSMHRDRILDIFAEYINQESFSNAAMKNLFSLLMIDLLRDSNTRIESPTPISGSDTLYQTILDEIRRNYQTLSLSELAEKTHFSKQYICKIIKEKSGNTFQNLLLHTRLKMVAQYLNDTALSIEEIAFLCGFSTPAHLSRCFKQNFGITPSAYRKSGNVNDTARTKN